MLCESIRAIALRQLLATVESVFGRLHSLLNSDLVYDLPIARVGLGDSEGEIVLLLSIDRARQFNRLRFYFGIHFSGR